MITTHARVGITSAHIARVYPGLVHIRYLTEETNDGFTGRHYCRRITHRQQIYAGARGSKLLAPVNAPALRLDCLPVTMASETMPMEKHQVVGPQIVIPCKRDVFTNEDSG